MASRYIKLSQRDHVLQRPDTYVGSVAKEAREEYVYTGDAIVKKSVSYSPAFLKIFDEILTNSADCVNRGAPMTTLKVTIDADHVTIYNDGCSIPVEKHEEGCYVPELIFGHLLTGENFDDAQERTGAGRNGYGSKLTNIFSKKFDVEIYDGTRKYLQTWSDNMTNASKPKVTKSSKPGSITTTFYPDFERFSMDSIDEDTRSVLVRRVYDMAAVLTKVKIFLDGKRLDVKGAKDYFEMYTEVKPVFESVDGWDIGVCPSDEFRSVSFVNASSTRGGTHVDLIANAVAKAVAEAALKKKVTVKPAVVKNKLFIFVNARVVNPSFSSQTKDILTSKNVKCSPSVAFLKKAVSAVLDDVIAETNVRESLVEMKNLKKTDGAKKVRLTGIKKLTDAAWAGTKHSGLCTLILTEGDSAATLATAGLAVVGRDRYGIFPLRGKLLNVRDASVSSITNNAEITAIKQILGLRNGTTYKDASSLRYGSVMIMSDQDVDGSHIAGLVLNFFHAQFPSLLEIPGFLKRFVTPIVVAKKGTKMVEFYSIPDFEEWKAATPDVSTWKTKYFKGLGTSDANDAKRYFNNLKVLVKTLTWSDDAAESIDKSFNKSRADERKTWLLDFKPGNQLDQKLTKIPVEDFINKDLILFSRYDVERSIPSVVDGLKPSQRKILFSAFKRNLVQEIKVAQFAGYVSEHAGYHHGEASLQGAIVGMAQDYVGSNNINLLAPKGQFGSRLHGGKDSASARYIFTQLSPNTRDIFHKADERLLNYLEDDGDRIEPEYYVPTIPFLLVNGANGIGTGFSTNIPSYNPKEIVNNVKRLINGKPMTEMTPWYKNFKGDIKETSPGVFTCHGVYEIKGKTVTVSELPVGTWTNEYKEYIESLIEKKIAADFREKHDETNVLFEIDFIGVPDPKILKLDSTIRTTNMHAFDPEGKIKKYDSPLDIITDWFATRKEFYIKRKEDLLKDLKARVLVAKNKSRFITSVNDGTLIITRRAEEDVIKDLNKMKFDKVDGSFEYLLGMKISSLTKERAEKLQAEAVTLEEELVVLKNTTAEQMWVSDIDAIKV
ncbi:DNA topoisomerase II [Acanthocystis turfacea Chlorella virus Can0610SP]|nr:DNA topoisomerase II [Acanthocystis turfacea Chlorella virus Can0610SP]